MSAIRLLLLFAVPALIVRTAYGGDASAGREAVNAAQLPPSLLDAEFLEIRAASAADEARYEAALEQWQREMFDGAAATGRDGTVVWFESNEYDAYLSFLHDNPPPPLWPVPENNAPQPQPDWPTLVISFSSPRALADFGVASTTLVNISFCGSAAPGIFGPFYFRGNYLVWRGMIVTKSLEEELALAITSEPQTYEVFFDYAFTDWSSDQEAISRFLAGEAPPPMPGVGDDLMPPEADLCLSVMNYDEINSETFGAPLRIPQDQVGDAVGILPRPVGWK